MINQFCAIDLAKVQIALAVPFRKIVENYACGGKKDHKDNKSSNISSLHQICSPNFVFKVKARPFTCRSKLPLSLIWGLEKRKISMIVESNSDEWNYSLISRVCHLITYFIMGDELRSQSWSFDMFILDLS